MNQIRRGSKEAFRELVKRWQPPVFKFFCLMGLGRCDAEDCVQETFLRLYSYRKRYRNLGSNFRAFLFRVSRNVCVDFHRKRDRGGSLSLGTEPAVADSVPLWNDLLDCEWALASLPERLRVVVVLNLYEDLRYGEIAAVLDIPVGTVKSRMYHALRQLREVLRADVGH